MCEGIGKSHVGLIHSGITAYVSGDGLIIHRIMYQKIFMDAKQVKSYPRPTISFHHGHLQDMLVTLTSHAVHHASSPLRQQTRPVKLILIVQCRNIWMVSNHAVDRLAFLEKARGLLIYVAECIAHIPGVQFSVECCSSPTRHEDVAYLRVLYMSRIPIGSNTIRKRKVSKIVFVIRVNSECSVLKFLLCYADLTTQFGGEIGVCALWIFVTNTQGRGVYIPCFLRHRCGYRG